jgi:hypothetical protein
MRISHTRIAAALAATTLAVSVAACSSTSSSTTAKSGSATSATTAGSPNSSAPAQASDYTRLLIKLTDINAPIPFTAGPPTNSPDGQPGAAITFSSQPHPEDQEGVTVKDVHILDTIRVLPDPAAATSALTSAKTGQGSLADGHTTDSANVGSDGTILSGKSPDNSKGVTMLLFTEGRTFVTLKFVGPVDDPPPPADFVTDLGQKQDAAVRKGLGG